MTDFVYRYCPAARTGSAWASSAARNADATVCSLTNRLHHAAREMTSDSALIAPHTPWTPAKSVVISRRHGPWHDRGVRTLTTERLTLRPWQLDDAEFVIDNPKAAEQLEIGAYYYVDFHPVPAQARAA
mgnify:CR=1 FL=1